MKSTALSYVTSGCPAQFMYRGKYYDGTFIGNHMNYMMFSGTIDGNPGTHNTIPLSLIDNCTTQDQPAASAV